MTTLFLYVTSTCLTLIGTTLYSKNDPRHAAFNDFVLSHDLSHGDNRIDLVLSNNPSAIFNVKVEPPVAKSCYLSVITFTIDRTIDANDSSSSLNSIFTKLH